MLKLFKTNAPYSSLKLNLMVACETVLLLAMSLAVLFYFSHRDLHREATENAEETLKGMVQHIDNILMTVEQSVHDFYPDLLAHIDQPERMFTLSSRIVESNPHVVGCAIAFTPRFYSDRELFMAYVHRSASALVTSETFGSTPYTEQEWFSRPVSTGRACWVGPLKDENTSNEALISYCMPIVVGSEGKCVGVFAVDLSVGLLSEIVLAAKPSPNSYSVLLGRDGSYIVYPDPVKLSTQTVFTQTENGADPSVREAAEAMVAGETGHKFFRMNDEDWYVFYRPFLRSSQIGATEIEKTGWSVGLVYPQDDVFGSYYRLLFWVLLIAVVSLLLFFLLSRLVLRRELKPLGRLTRSAHRIAEGHYDELIPDTTREDEIGQLQENFQKMQRSLSANVNELNRLTTTLQDKSEILQKAYGQNLEADRMKSSLLHYMTGQMSEPSETIENSVTRLCNNYHTISPEEADREVAAIKQQSKAILDLIDQMAGVERVETAVSRRTNRKEDGHE